MVLSAGTRANPGRLPTGRSRRSSRTGLLALALLLAATSRPVLAEPLPDALRGLLDTHPQVQASQKTMAASEEQVRQAFAGYLPRVDLVGDTGAEYVDNPERRAYYDDAYLRGRQTAGIVASQKLFDGGLTSATHESAKAQKAAAGSQYDATVQAVIFEGLSAYLGVLKQRDLVALARQNEDNIKRQLNLEDERVRRGAGIAVDVLQAKSRLQISKERRVSVEGGLREAIARYQQVYGHAPQMDAMTVVAAPLSAIPETLEEVVVAALEENPAIFSADRQSDVAEQNREAAHAQYFPTVALEAAANYENNKNTVTGVRRDYSVLVRANWNLFNGFATQAGVAKAAYEYGASQDNALHVRRKTEEQARVAWEQLVTARQRVALLRNAVNIAAEVLDARRKLREAGNETAINVLDAENEVYTARLNLTAAVYDARVAAFRVLQGMGRLSLDTALSSPEEQELALPPVD